MKFGSLFSGIGGIDLGFERAGFSCQWQVEIDDYATAVLQKHWPDVPKHSDVRSFNPTEPVDVICSGFPCQDISYAGQAKGLDGERSGLFFETIRIARAVRPRWIVLENVPALLNRGLDRVLMQLDEIGCDAEWHCFPASCVGAVHRRDRCWVIANARGTGLSVPKQEDIQRAWRWLKGRATSKCSWWTVEPNVVRVAHGVPKRVDRIRSLGNSVVPQVAQVIAEYILWREQNDLY